MAGNRGNRGNRVTKYPFSATYALKGATQHKSDRVVSLSLDMQPHTALIVLNFFYSTSLIPET